MESFRKGSKQVPRVRRECRRSGFSSVDYLRPATATAPISKRQGLYLAVSLRLEIQAFFDESPTIQFRHFPPCSEEFGGKSGGKRMPEKSRRTPAACRRRPRMSAIAKRRRSACMAPVADIPRLLQSVCSWGGQVDIIRRSTIELDLTGVPTLLGPAAQNGLGDPEPTKPCRPFS